jgi:hypothetical protein
MVTHVLAVDGHRRRGRFGGGAMPIIVGAADHGDERERGEAGKNQIFHHRYVLS